MGTVVIQYGDEVPERHYCDLPDEATTGTIVQCEDCGEYWRCFGQRHTGVFMFPCPDGKEPSDAEPKWEKLGLFSTWYYVWRHRA